MPRTLARVLGWDKCAEIAGQIIQNVFMDTLSGTPFHKEISRVIGRWKEPSTGVASIAALPALTCAAAGGAVIQAAPLVAAWQLVRLAAKHMDDIEDRDADASAVAINVAIGLVFAVQLTLGRLSNRKPSRRTWQVSSALPRALLRSAAGQHADLMASQSNVGKADPDSWLEIALAKSGELLAWAAWAGALVGGANEPALSHYRDYGLHLGVLLQIADDFNDTWCPEESSDIAASRLSLPLCYTWSVASEKESARLKTLLRQANMGDKTAESQVRQDMIDLGAQGFLLVAARLQYQQATAALKRARCVKQVRPSLLALLDQMFPVLSLARN